MKLLFASDIHGSKKYCEMLKERFLAEKAERLILLGDLLYHGPRNDLPEEYNPKAVIEILNSLKDAILCVRGNCDAFVDQMVLQFPIMADYMPIYLAENGTDPVTFFITHGHTYNPDTPPPLRQGDIFMQGHTHIPAMEVRDNYLFLNPGSISIPKDGSCASYMVYEAGGISLKNLQGEVLKEMKI